MLNSCWMHINSGGLFSTLKKIYIRTLLSSCLHISLCADLEEKGEWPHLIYTVKLPKICLGSPWKTSISLGPSQVKIFWICTWSPMQYLSTVQCTHLFQNMSTFSVHTLVLVSLSVNNSSVYICTESVNISSLSSICHHFNRTLKSEVTANISGACSDSTPFTV